MKLTKTKLKQIIREEIQRLNEGKYSKWTYEDIAIDLVKNKIIKKKMKSDKYIPFITKALKKRGNSDREIDYYYNVDEDFLSDTVTAINRELKKR